MIRRAALVFLMVALGVGGVAIPIVASATADEPVIAGRAGGAAADVPAVVVTDEMRAHQRWLDGLYFAGAFYGFLALVAVLALGISRRLRDLARRVTRREFLAGMITYALFALVMAVLSLPLDLLSGYVVPHRFDLSDQSLLGWLGDQGKELVMGMLIGSPLVALALLGIRKVRRWWLALWLGAVPVVLLLLLVAPVVLDPVFNTFKPLEDEALRADIVRLAERAGIAGGRVYQVDKSKQTKTMNAYVNGLGPTKRIVLWDTIIAKMQRDELLFVMAHEMGHYVLHHVWILVGVLLALLFVVFWAAQRAVDWATARWGQSWGFAHPHDPAAIPLLLLVVSVALFLLTPALNAYSRKIEHDADTFALEMTRDGAAGARAFVKLAEDSKVLPDPHPFIRFWRYSHPTLAERIAYCASYRPWEEGRPNRLFRAGASPAP